MTREQLLDRAKEGITTYGRGVDKAAFEKFGVTVLDPAGEKFDPHHHQAMTAIESDAPAHSVLQVFQKGFKLHDRVIRPAMVAVAKPRPAADEAGTAPA